MPNSLASQRGRRVTRSGFDMPSKMSKRAGLYGKAGSQALLCGAEALACVPVGLVAIDMPLSLEPIVGRRVSDNAVSSAYGARHRAPTCQASCVLDA
jgi:hypothetical protein